MQIEAGKIILEHAELAHTNGLEIAVPGFLANPTDGTTAPAQIFVEIYEGRLQVHVWAGDEDPSTTVIIERSATA